MLKNFFQENKMVVFASLAIFFVLQIGVLVRNNQNILGLESQQYSYIPNGCYYKLNCPPTPIGQQTTFNCLPVLICVTPTATRPTIYQTPLSCQTCLNRGYNRLCYNTTNRTTYCSNNLTAPPGVNCITCRRTTPTPTRRPSYYYPSRTPTLYPTRYTSCKPLGCTNPPPNCRYIGGDNCTTCGRLYCITPYPTSPYN